MRKKLVLMICLFMFALTLASDTQQRAKVHVHVLAGDENVRKIIDSHLKKELRSQWDVNIVESEADWEHLIEIYAMSADKKDGSPTGMFTIASYDAYRVPKARLKYPIDYERRSPIMWGSLGADFYAPDDLPEFCRIHVRAFGLAHLEQ